MLYFIDFCKGAISTFCKLVSCASFFIFYSIFSVNAQESVTLATIDNNPLQSMGLAILEEAYERIGVKLIAKKVPAARALCMSDGGYVDGEIQRVWGIEKLYPNLVAVPVPINIMEGVVFTKHVSLAVNGWESLRPYTIGIRRGIKYIERETAGMRVEPVSSLEQVFMKLDAGRTDLVVCARHIGLIKIKMLGLRGIRAIEPPLFSNKLYHYLNKKHTTTILPRITKALQAMEAEGRIKAIWLEKIRETQQ